MFRLEADDVKNDNITFDTLYGIAESLLGCIVYEVFGENDEYGKFNKITVNLSEDVNGHNCIEVYLPKNDMLKYHNNNESVDIHHIIVISFAREVYKLSPFPRVDKMARWLELDKVLCLGNPLGGSDD